MLLAIPMIATAVNYGELTEGSYQVGYYTHSGCPGNSSNRVDPVNVVFYNWGTLERAINGLETHTLWRSGGGTTQWFLDSTGCYGMADQRAEDGVSHSRFHIRLHPVAYSDLGWTTIGDAHHEDVTAFWSGCVQDSFPYLGNHSVDKNGPDGSGFDQGRRAVRENFEAAGHSWMLQYWGNTQSIQQCDGDWASSDGQTLFMNMHQGLH